MAAIIGLGQVIYTQAVSIRKTPDTSEAPFGQLQAGQLFNVIAQQTNTDGSIWLQLDNGLWTAKVYGAKTFCSLTLYIGTAQVIYTQAVSIRKTPDTSEAPVGQLLIGQRFNVIAQQTNTDGSIWLQLDNGLWTAKVYGGKTFCSLTLLIDPISVVPTKLTLVTDTGVTYEATKFTKIN